MKKRISLLLMAGLVCFSLTACAVDIPFLNKGDKEETTEENAGDDMFGDEPIMCAVKESPEFIVGQIITAEDLVDMDPSLIGQVVVSAIIDDTGMAYESVQLDTAGTFVYELAIDFSDGTSFGDVATITVVEEGSATSGESTTESDISETSEIPAEILDNIARYSWSSEFIEGAKGTEMPVMLSETSTVLSYNSNVIEVSSPVGVVPIDLGQQQEFLEQAQFSGNMQVLYLPYDVEQMLNGEGYSPFVRDTKVDFTIELSKALSNAIGSLGVELAEENGQEEDVEEFEELNNASMEMLDWCNDLIQSITSVNTKSSGQFMYDTNGKSYEIYEIEYVWDMSLLGVDTGEISNVRFAYIEYDNGYIIFEIPFTGSTASLNSTDEDVIPPTSYDSFVQLVAENPSMLNGFKAGDSMSAMATVQQLATNMIIGDYSTLTGDEHVDEEGQVDIVVPTDGEEEDKLTGANGDKILPYNAKFPQLFTWWSDIQAAKEYYYRRWVIRSGGDYSDASGVTYVGSIVRKDGASGEVGGEEVDWQGFEDWLLENMGNESDDPNTSVGSGSIQTNNFDTFTLSSSYGDYEISNQYHQNVKFNTSQSTSGRLVMTLDNEKYYMEAVRSTQVNNLITECLYPTSTFMDSSYTVTEGNSSDVFSTSIGKITPYKINYTDLNGTSYSKPYMAVYEINGDYIVIYADNLPQDEDDTFTMLLESMVSVKE